MPSPFEKLPPGFIRALTWFAENQGNTLKVPARLADGTLLQGSQGGGIYCPQGGQYALSLKSTLGAQENAIYADAEPCFEADGSWTYDYHEVRSKPNVAGTEKNPTWKNQRLLKNWVDGIPVGVFREIILPGSKSKIHEILGLAYVVNHDPRTGFFTLRSVHLPTTRTNLDLHKLSRDSRKLTETIQVVRQGQAVFRAQLLQAYEGKCALTGFDLPDALEAAHISPYRGQETNILENGLLLRADLHGLFDAGVIAFNPGDLSVMVNRQARGSRYERELGKATLRPPNKAHRQPSAELLALHLKKWAHCFEQTRRR
jgi:hypothetical protein